MFLKSALVATAAFTSSALAAFGVTTSGSNIVVDAGSSNALVFTVNSGSCDITSIKYRGEEFQYASKGSHISSGLGTATVKSEIVSSQYVKITCTTSTLTQYMVVKSGESTIYMATYTTAEPDIGELRFIARLNPTTLPSEYPFGVVSTTAGSSSAVEGSDVYNVGSETRSKFYSSERFIDDTRQCVYRGEDVHVCMLLNDYSYEASSGGPFHRDINSNNAGDSTNLYFYMNSGHVQTESFRQGLHGPYAMAFTRSGIPSGGSSLDTTFFKDLSITGYVAPSARGTVTGTATGAASSMQKVLHWYNSAAQYWVYADSTGKFTSPAMKPGTYTQVFYQDEYQLKAQSVTVKAGSATTANIVADSQTRDTIWTIGEWDGQPTGFRNADKQLRMHPSDSRMSSWGPLTYTVGTSTLDSVPMAIWKDLNPLTIKFTGTYTGAATLRVGTTLSFAGCRPAVVVNSYSTTTPAAPTKIDSRGVTRGAYRGFGEIYTYAIPSGTLVSGSNTITVSCASGSSGDTYLAPNIILDAIELYK
ncbi:polysaccharide lyase family 4 protein [Dothidotthia symphoricarpi CBS 119687]|uniref:Rhamnogalacturonate lyase n=1 Tax=Dothidotthia symphoricarpi CBS 119687 TaxID=1392245 RepID=A0A6A6A108_9PLEO|nr:polysaccharide lyase family 4 protein [Dothidotthia symphoricarpi CBS 119687]KAF2125539.1 polysaccharide lyase family 4 protein [Dothidotthia symphoricarpi CBS 119687]